MGLTDHSGLRRRTAGTPLAVQNPFSPDSVPNRDLSSGRRNKESSSEGSHFRGTLCLKCRILQQTRSCGEEGRSVTTPSKQSSKLQQVSDIPPLQDGRLENSFRPTETMEFQVYARPEGCIFHNPITCQVSEIHPPSNSEKERVNSIVSHSG